MLGKEITNWIGMGKAGEGKVGSFRMKIITTPHHRTTPRMQLSLQIDNTWHRQSILRGLFCICFCVVFGSSHALSVAAEPIQHVELVPEAVSERKVSGCLVCIKPVISSEVCFFFPCFCFHFFFHKQESTKSGQRKKNFTVPAGTSYWIYFQSVIQAYNKKV